MSCHGVDGLFHGDEVNIGYRPYRAQFPTAIRTGRGPEYATVVVLRAGQGLGRQTVRNPDHQDYPPNRPAEVGEDGRPWIWVYARSHGGSGWVPLDDVAATTSPPGRPCRGPAGFDFEPGLMPSKRGPRTACGPANHLPARWRRRVVDQDVYLRWSPDGTAFDYLHQDDVVELRCGGPRAYAGVTVVDARAARAGVSGWVDLAALERVPALAIAQRSSMR
ncbi:MAG TPA: hypothetical protein VI318_03500 [Baekduia sp.]